MSGALTIYTTRELVEELEREAFILIGWPGTPEPTGDLMLVAARRLRDYMEADRQRMRKAGDGQKL